MIRIRISEESRRTRSPHLFRYLELLDRESGKVVGYRLIDVADGRAPKPEWGRRPEGRRRDPRPGRFYLDPGGPSAKTSGAEGPSRTYRGGVGRAVSP